MINQTMHVIIYIYPCCVPLNTRIFAGLWGVSDVLPEPISSGPGK